MPHRPRNSRRPAFSRAGSGWRDRPAAGSDEADLAVVDAEGERSGVRRPVDVAGAGVVGVRPRRDVGDLSPVAALTAHREDLDAIRRLGLERDPAIAPGECREGGRCRHERRKGDRPEHRREAATHSRLSVDVCSHPGSSCLWRPGWPHPLRQKEPRRAAKGSGQITEPFGPPPCSN